MQDKIFDMLLKDDEITWQNVIYNLVKKEEMDPWDINISLLAKRFLEMIKTLKKMDFRISGKMILAAAILLRIKSHRLVSEDLSELDRLIAMSEETQEEFYDELEHSYDKNKGEISPDQFRLIPKTPQPRNRKVSVYDLVEALQKALEVKNRRKIRFGESIDIEIPKETIDISVVIADLYGQIKEYMNKKQSKKITFSQLLKSDKKEDKICTFVPLLHLDHQRKINMQQEFHLGEIDIYLLSEKEQKEEMPEEKAKEYKEVTSS